MAVLRLFAAAREAAGTGRDEVPGDTVGAVLDAAAARYGPDFAAVLVGCKVWRNGEEARREEACADDDEVAVLPPVSGGASRWVR
jgi:molybdopterin converting factor small subunit